MTEKSAAIAGEALGPVPDWDRRDTWAVCGLALACLFLFVRGLGAYSLWDPWESMHAAAMVEMTERGDWITPWLDGKADGSQPVLIYWAMAVPMSMLGNTEFTARLPSALTAVIGVLLLFYCVRCLRGFNTALVAAAALTTLPLYFYMARQAMPDMLLAALLTGAMGFFALARFREARRPMHLALFYACLGLAVLAKGPLAVAITGGALSIFALFEIDRESLFAPAAWWPGLRSLATRYRIGMGAVILFVICTPWHLALFFKYGVDGLTNSFMLGESLQYFTGSVGGDDGTSEFYARDLFHGMYPWASLLPLSLLCLFHGSTRFDEDARQKWYFASWFTVVFALFTLGGTKLDHYLLPIAPAVAVLVALVFEAWFRKDAPFWVTPGLLISIPFALLPIRDFLVEGDADIFGVFTRAEPIDHPGLHTGLKIFLAAWIVAVLIAALRRRSWIAVGLAIAVAYGHAVYMTQGVLPDHSTMRNLRSYTDLFERVREPDAELFLYGAPAYSVNYYFGRERFRHFAEGTADELAARVAGKPHVYIIAEARELRELSNALRSTRWFQIADDHPDYVLLTNSREALPAR